MAMETLVVGKCGNASTPVELIKGDNYTQKIMMRVPRYFGGVDLAPLAWSVTVENAAGATDEYALSAIRGEDAIEMEWIPGGTATAVPGIVKFKLSGFGEDKNILVWQSGTYHIRVKDTFSHTPGSEVAAELTGVQKLIIYVDGELNKVIKAGTDAAEAAKAANAAADRANSVADGKNEGRITALEQFTTKPVEPYAVEGKLVQLDNFEGMPMNAVTRIEPVQAGSGEPSPSNIRPISGHTGAKLVRCGKNLLKKTMVSGTQSGITFTVNTDGSITTNGTAAGDCYRTVCTDVGLPAGDYILSGCPTSGGSGKYILYFAPSESPNVTDAGHGANITVREGQTHAVTIRINKGVTVNNITFYPMIRKASETDGTYEPYQGETFSASFGQTVYGGTLDWGKGVLTVDRAIVTLAGTENFQFSSGGAGRFVYYGLQNVIKPFSNSAIVAPIVCSHYKPSTADYLYNTPDAYAIAQNNGTEIWFSDTGFDSQSTFKAYLSTQNASGTPVQVCYKLANPTTIQLTPAQLTALQGMNNIFCDAGETTVSGRKDIMWLTSGLIEQIDTLKKAIISLGGNV